MLLSADPVCGSLEHVILIIAFPLPLRLGYTRARCHTACQKMVYLVMSSVPAWRDTCPLCPSTLPCVSGRDAAQTY